MQSKIEIKNPIVWIDLEFTGNLLIYISSIYIKLGLDFHKDQII